MKSNQWWIRDLFRYFLTTLSSIAVISYVIFSAIFPKNDNSEIFNEDFFSEVAIEYPWEDIILKDNQESGLKWNWDINKNQISKMALNTTKIITNQSLLDENLFAHEEDAITESSDNEVINWDLFDIEKIISDLHLQKEKRVAVVAKQLWVDWKNEKLDYAKLAWIDWEYNWSLEQNQKIRNYLIANAQEIYKDKHWWNEWDTLPLVSKEEKKVKMNAKEITWWVTYNDVTLKVEAPIESFPEWTILKIKTLWDEDSTTTFDITFKEIVLMTQEDNVDYDAPMASFDICFYAPDDVEFLNELQPAEWKSVSVTFDYANNKEFKNSEDGWFLAIYHIEDKEDISVANLISVKDSEDKRNTKSDSMSIYANTLSVYILTIVSELDEEFTGENKTIRLDAGSGGFIVSDESIILSSTWTKDTTYTWKIIAKDNEIILPEVKLTSWYSFWWWYNGNKLLWNPGSIFKLWISNNSEWEESDLDIEIYACVYWDAFTWNLCILNENEKSDLEILVETLDNENNTDFEIYSPSQEEIEKYGEDVFVAYNWAIKNGITSIDDVSQVKFNKKITRAELAKMMVAFMSWTLWKVPTTTWEVNYKDVDSEKLWDLAWYIQLAYQYQIMWINADWTPIEDFNPNKTVTRAEFATVLSRVLYGNTYNQNWKNYYEKHIEALGNANILSNTNPDLVEARWRIMTMLYNAQNSITINNNQGIL